MAPASAGAIGVLKLRVGQSVLDAGCGPGGVLPLLCAGVAPTGKVLGIDISRAHVERARQLVRERGLQDAVAVEVADLRSDLPVEEASCDVVWMADVLYPDAVGDSEVVVSRLSRLLKPGGAMAIFYGNWLRPMYLPGYARLEHLICAARETVYARERHWQGQTHPERALGWLQRAGLVSCRPEIFPAVHRQPLPEEVRSYITAVSLGTHYARAVETCGEEVGMKREDVELWRRLSDPRHHDFILDQPDYYCLAAALLVLGFRPE